MVFVRVHRVKEVPRRMPELSKGVYISLIIINPTVTKIL